MSKILISILFATTLLGACLSNTQYQGCEEINGNTCIRCYQRKPLGRAKGCGPVLNDTDLCERYLFSIYTGDSFCSQCGRGHSLQQDDFNGAKSRCKAKNTIQGCLDSQFSGKGQPQFCYSCAKNTYPRLSNRDKCVDIGAKAVKHCELGGFALGNGVTCGRCKAPYALSFNRRACVAPAIPGCSQNDGNGGCLRCDAPNGYYMVPGGRCIKQVAKAKQLLRD